MLTSHRATIRHSPGRQNTLDETAFDVVTPESAYWVGFLMATGSITRAGTRSPAIAVTTADEDRAHLERFRSFVKAMEPITVGTQEPASLGTQEAQIRVRTGENEATIGGLSLLSRGELRSWNEGRAMKT